MSRPHPFTAPAFRPAALFRPASVVLVADPGLVESSILAANLARGAFAGRRFAVGLEATGLEATGLEATGLEATGLEATGLEVVGAVGALPVAPDLAVVSVAAGEFEGVLAALAARGCHAVVVAGAAPELSTQAARAGVRALGQGSFGVIVPAIGLDASLAHLPTAAGRLALVAQSAAVTRAVLDWAAGAAVGFSHVIGVGGNASLGFATALDWLAQDRGTGAILLDIRRIHDRRGFISAARAAARTRPVVAICGGAPAAADEPTCPLAADDALMRPLAADDAVTRAALRRAGVLVADGLEDLLAAAQTLARRAGRGRPGADAGDRVAVVSNGHGPAQLATDALRRAGLRAAVLSMAARTALGTLLPGSGGADRGAPATGARPEAPTAARTPLPRADRVGSAAGALQGAGTALGPLLPAAGGAARSARAAGALPLIVGPAAGLRLAEAAAMLAGLPEVDAVVAVHAPTADASDAAAVPAMVAAAEAGLGRAAPVLVAWLGEATAAEARQRMAAAGLSVFATPEEAVRGARHLALLQQGRLAAAELPAREMLPLQPDRALVGARLAAARAAGRDRLQVADALAVLGAYGMPVAPTRAVATPDAAAAAATALGFPVVLKRLSPDAPRKTAWGGVVLDLWSATAVREAAAAMLARRGDGLRSEGFLVQRQAGRAAELRLVLDDDPMWGPWIGLGPGGAAAALCALGIELPPLNRALAAGLVGRSGAMRLLDGTGGRAAADLDAVADALVRLSQIAIDWPEIAALSIDPLFADATGVVAADAELRLRAPGEVGRLAIVPYPAELAGTFALRDGTVLTVRPIRPEDATAHQAAFARLRPADVRFRFFAPLREMSPEFAARLTNVDYGREMAFIAALSRSGLPDRTVGTARLVQGPGPAEGEFAVIVADELKGQGLGRHLMERLIAWGRSMGVAEMHGQVLAENTGMLAFVRALGFTLRRSREEDGVMEARLAL